MLWRSTLGVALIAVVAGCAAGSTEGAADFWDRVPSSDDQRWEVISRAQKIDTCAVLPRAGLASLGTLREKGVMGFPSTCSAVLDAPGGTVVVDLSVHTGPTAQSPESMGTVVQSGSTEIRLIEQRWMRDSDQPGCVAWLKFPAELSLSLSVQGVQGDSLCGPVDQLARQVIVEWKTEPPVTPGPANVLAARDVCAVMPGPYDVDARAQNVDMCSVTYRGLPVSVMFHFSTPGPGESSTARVVGDRNVYRQSGDAPLRDIFEVGEAGPVVGKPDLRQISTVTIYCRDEAILDEVTEKVVAALH